MKRCFVVSDVLVDHPARELLQWITESYTPFNSETGKLEHLSDSTPSITISVHPQTLSTFAWHPTTFTLAHTPVRLGVGQYINIIEFSGGGPPVGVAKIAAFHAIEEGWVELLAQLGPGADCRHGSPFIRIALPRTHVFFPPVLEFLHSKFSRYLPEILACSSLRLPDPLPVNFKIRARL